MNWQTLDSFPAFPPVCACCLQPTDATLEVLSQLRVTGSMMRPIDRPWLVPYCADCQQHVAAAWQAGGKFFRKAALIGGLCLVPFAPFHILFFVALLLIGLTLAVFYAISRLRMKAIPIGPRCTSPTLAVLRKGPAGAQYSIKILNSKFALTSEPAAQTVPQQATS